jgi:hypothetical protein
LFIGSREPYAIIAGPLAVITIVVVAIVVVILLFFFLILVAVVVEAVKKFKTSPFRCDNRTP